MNRFVLASGLLFGILGMVASTVSHAQGTVIPPTDGINTLGSRENDLVYTPLPPCRILDTRAAAAGAIASASERNVRVGNFPSFSSQGGSATDCGTTGLRPSAVAVNFTVVSPVAQGFITVYSFGTTRPLAATLVYAPGSILSNSAIIKNPFPVVEFDFTIYTSAQTHVVADIVGYFAPPVATGLQCQETANTQVSIPAGATLAATAPACPTGYTQTATNCDSASSLMPLAYIRGGSCTARNGDSTPRTLSVSRTCCRIPGR